jgi:hypothetical protein
VCHGSLLDTIPFRKRHARIFASFPASARCELPALTSGDFSAWRWELLRCGWHTAHERLAARESAQAISRRFFVDPRAHRSDRFAMTRGM